jgi:hypothetical protein
VENIGDIWQDYGLNMHPSHDEHTPLPAVTPAASPGARPSGAEPSAEPLSTLPAAPREIGGRDGPDPTRFGDWEKSGRCIDF